MEKYANLVKAMSICAGPDCDKSCPYNGKGARNKSCRSMLLEDAMQALVFEEARANEADEHIVSLNDDIDTLEAANNNYRTERDKLAAELAALKLSKQEGKTDRPSVISDDLEKQIGELVAHANYQQGRADALAAIVERCSFGGGCRHE